MQAVGEAQRRQGVFLCWDEEGFPEEMLELGLTKCRNCAVDAGTPGRENNVSKGSRLAGLPC